MQSLFEKLDKNTLLVTHLPRQAQLYRLAFAKWKQGQGINAWPSPRIFSWNEWLKGLGEELLWSGYSSPEGVRSLITPLQEHTVWEQLIRSQTKHPLMHVPSTASIARQAWNLMQAWRLPDPRVAKFPTEDVSAFSSWAAAYYKRCKSAGWIDHARLADTLKTALKKNKLESPPELIVAGFLEFTPQQRELLNALEEQSCRVSLYQAKKFDVTPQGLSFSSAQDEYFAIAKWSREILEKEPNVTIGIVVSNLNDGQDELAYAMRKTLYPESFSSTDEFSNRTYQFSSGMSLAQSELALMAMYILELLRGKFSLEQISQVLRNPYFNGGRTEHTKRLKLEAWLQQQGVIEFELNEFLGLLKIYHEANPENKSSLFEACMLVLRSASNFSQNNYAPSIWANHFVKYLEKFAWPNTELSHNEQREAQAMRACISELATLDFVHSEITLSTALGALRKILNRKKLNLSQIFSPIQILDIKEVYALNFDYLWVSGLDQAALPETQQVNPMLPYAWQKKRAVSLSTPELCLQAAQKRIAHLCTASPFIRISYVSTGNNDKVQISNLLSDIDFIDQIPELKTIMADQSEWVQENHGPELFDKNQVGTSVFKFQAECPFKAFAKTRLLPRPAEQSAYGFTALERGNLLHQALEKIWLNLGDYGSLKMAIENDSLELLVLDVVDSTVFLYEKRQEQKLSVRLKAIEKTRLVRLIMAWLLLETKREPFSMQQVEESVELEINGLMVKGYIDRVDQVHDVGFVIIDYKSGSKSSSAWFSERPDEPQMPIYALALQNKITAIVYANLKAGEMGFNGISQTDNAIPKIKSYDSLGESRRRGFTWAELMPHWRETFNKLADDYKSGFAVPAPKRNLQTCKYCELETLCRVNASENADHLFEEVNDV